MIYLSSRSVFNSSLLFPPICCYMYNGNVQQNPLLVEPCVTEDFYISPRFSPMIFDPHANSVLLRAHLCTAVLLLGHICTAVLIGSMRRTLCSKLFMMRA